MIAYEVYMPVLYVLLMKNNPCELLLSVSQRFLSVHLTQLCI